MQFARDKNGLYLRIMMEGDICLCLEEASNIMFPVPKKDLIEVSVAEYLNNTPEINSKVQKKSIDQDKELFDDEKDDNY